VWSHSSAHDRALAGKVCIFTGAGSGIGRASAALFAAEGATVVAADLDPDVEGVTHRVDVGEEHETQALAEAVVAEHGRIDVLFNNAGIAAVGDVGERRASSCGSASCA